MPRVEKDSWPVLSISTKLMHTLPLKIATWWNLILGIELCGVKVLICMYIKNALHTISSMNINTMLLIYPCYSCVLLLNKFVNTARNGNVTWSYFCSIYFSHNATYTLNKTKEYIQSIIKVDSASIYSLWKPSIVF